MPALLALKRGMSFLPPRQVCIAGALFIAFGVRAVTEMITKLFDGHVYIDFGFIGISVGYGILIGRASSRKWALLIAIAALVLAAVTGGWMTYAFWTGGFRATDPNSVVDLVGRLLAAALCLYVLMALCRSGNREWFAAEKEEATAARSLTWAVVAVSAILHISQQTSEWRARKTLEQIYPFHVRVEPYNAEDGKGLTNLSYVGEGVGKKRSSKPKLPRMNEKTIHGSDGIQCEFDGIATQPFQMTLHSNGFEDKTITIDQNSDPVIRVPMQSLVAAKLKRDADGKPAAPAVKE